MNPEHIPSLANEPDFTDANCRNLDPQSADEYFYPTQYNSAAAKMARRVCMNCVILDDCRDYALQTMPDYGIWGGHSAPEIRAMVAGGEGA